MQITATILESNARRNNMAIINGVAVAIQGLTIIGSEKQIAWAQKIAEKEIRLMVEARVRKAAGNGLMDGAELDALMVTINADLAKIAPRIDGKHATLWIDNRDGGAVTIRAVSA